MDGTIDDGPADGAAGGGVLVVSGEDEVGPDVAVEAVDAVAPQVGRRPTGYWKVVQDAESNRKEVPLAHWTSQSGSPPESSWSRMTFSPRPRGQS